MFCSFTVPMLLFASQVTLQLYVASFASLMLVSRLDPLKE
jgi:hypothetical protein